MVSVTWLSPPHFPTLSLCPHFFLLDASYFMFQQALGFTHLCNFHLIFIFIFGSFLRCPLGIPSYHLYLTNSHPSFITHPGCHLLWKPSQRVGTQRIQLWVLLYRMPLLPVLNYNYLLSEYLLCPTSSVFGFLKGKKCGIHLCLPHHCPTLSPIIVPNLRI